MADHLPFPAQPSSTARQRGLGVRALADLEAMARELKDAGSEDAAAARYGVTIATFERRFRELAKAAKWPAWNPDDYLAGRASKERRGGRRHGGLPLAETVSFGGRVSPKTKDAVEEARAVLTEEDGPCSLDDFLREAAAHVLAGHRFLTAR